jgi:RNA polymerase sigma factor (sigma-70 family)
MRETTDSELWRLAAGGEPAAFGTIFERHARAVYNHCFRRTANWSLAEELTSMVFLEAWRRRGSVRLDRDSALPWLLGVATNVIRNERRSRRRHRAALDRLPEERGNDFAGDADARMDDERRMRIVLRRVARMPRSDQDVLALCAWAGLSYDQAAVGLGIPVGTVRSRLSRARARLEKLERADESDPDRSAIPFQEA